MMDSTWEERMAERAAKRREAQSFYRGVEWREEARVRPDLPHCSFCDDGRLCNCKVYPSDVDFWCACLGFIDCPTCPRTREPLRFF